MDAQYIFQQLENNIDTFSSLLKTSSLEEALWKPDSDKWCLLEIVCHLVDEEVDDFRARTRTALDEKKHPFYAIDPVGWVLERKYLEQDFQSKVQEWISERKASIEWLKSLENPDWTSSFKHVDFGDVTAGHFLANWLAHDHIHIRQINRTRRAYLDHISGQNLMYAGRWNNDC